MFVKISEDSYFFYHADVELLFAANTILQGEPVHQLCSKIYGEKRISELKRKYHFLFEVFESHKNYAPAGIFEPLLMMENIDASGDKENISSTSIGKKNVSIERFALKDFQEYLERIGNAAFLKQYFDLREMKVEEIQKAIKEEDKLEALYTGEVRLSDSFLGLQSMFLHTDRFIREYFSMAEELRTSEFEKSFEEQQEKVMKLLMEAKEQLKEQQPLEYSQQIMGKTFYNRGPYEKFYFGVSLFMSYRTVRFFEKNQILFRSLREVGMNDEEVIQKLKIIADDTRFRIITLLGEEKSVRGMDIAKKLKLAPSTVSHHMEQLSKAGIVHEEPVKNSKYYSLNQNALNGMLERLGKILKK